MMLEAKRFSVIVLTAVSSVLMSPICHAMAPAPPSSAPLPPELEEACSKLHERNAKDPHRNQIDVCVPGTTVRFVDAGCRPLEGRRVFIDVLALEAKHESAGCTLMWGIIPACWGASRWQTEAVIPTPVQGENITDSNGEVRIPPMRLRAGRKYSEPLLTVGLYNVVDRAKCLWGFTGPNGIQDMPAVVTCQAVEDTRPESRLRIWELTKPSLRPYWDHYVYKSGTHYQSQDPAHDGCVPR